MLKIFMYGSCVSRDTYDFFSREDCKLLGYVSRQSVISTFNATNADILSGATMSSKFQLRNSLGDFNGDLFDRLDAEGGEADLFIWDLVDERNGVVSASDGRTGNKRA